MLCEIKKNRTTWTPEELAELDALAAEGGRYGEPKHDEPIRKNITIETDKTPTGEPSGTFIAKVLEALALYVEENNLDPDGADLLSSSTLDQIARQPIVKNAPASNVSRAIRELARQHYLEVRGTVVRFL